MNETREIENYELRDIYTSPYIYRIAKRGIACYCMGGNRNAYKNFGDKAFEWGAFVEVRKHNEEVK
jgi:hypothetical protein